MPGPWEKYRKAKPWEKYAATGGPKRTTTRPDFASVQSRVDTVPDYPRSTEPYEGPLLEPSTAVAGAPAAPTLDETNAANRALRESPEGQAMYDRAMLDAKRHAFQELPAGMRMVIGAGSRVAAAGRGIGQLYAAAADQIAPRDADAPSRYDDAMAREAEARRRDAYLTGDYAGTVGRFVGDAGLLAAPAGSIGRLSGAKALAGNVGLGAAYAGAQPVVQGESRATNAALGGAFGGAGYGLSQTVGAIGRNAMRAVPQDVRAMARRANDLGIPVHAGQVSQSPTAKVAASAGKYLPFSGYASAARRQQEAVNRAVSKTFGEDAPKLTDDVMHRARQKLSKQFEEIYDRNAVPIDERGARRLLEIERSASRRLTNDETQVLRNQLDDILDNAEDGVLTGQKYQAVRTALRKAEGNDKLGMAVRELRQALDDVAAGAVGQEDAAALKALRSQWANFRTVEQALKQVAGAGGDIRLASLWPLIRKGSTKEMRELARMGQTLLKDPIGDSGTAQRSLIYNLLMGGVGLSNPAIVPALAKTAVGGATIGRVANSNALARLLARENRGVPATKLGALLEKGAPYAAPVAAQRYEENRR